MTDSDREQIQHVLDDETSCKTKLNRASILLMSANGIRASEISETLDVGRATVSIIRRQFVEHGIDRVPDLDQARWFISTVVDTIAARPFPEVDLGIN